jgi:DNA-binding PadR family transcriptional regulator
VDKIVEKLEKAGYLRSEDHPAGRGKKTKKYFAVKD